MFNYSPLSREKRETRFFRFSPICQSDPDGLSLELQHGSLDDDTLQYRALSYVWGDAKGKVMIEVNGEQFLVGENLHALLRQLRYGGVECWLWADAVCIQQSDDDEKSWHVQRMCDIFKTAEFVYAWLGPGSEATDVAMDFFEDWGPRALEVGVVERLRLTYTHMDSREQFRGRLSATTHLLNVAARFNESHLSWHRGTVEDNLTNNSWEVDMAKFFYDLLHVEGLRGTDEKSVLTDLETGIINLLTNHYWHRVWIFQEVALARQVYLLCGTKIITILHFEAVLEAIWKFRDEYVSLFFGLNSPLRAGFCARFPSELYPNKAILIRQLFCRQEVVTLSTILLAFSNHSERPWYRATDPRDIVYGILGLLADDDRRPLGDVDYENKTWVGLFTQATRRLIEVSLEERYLMSSIVNDWYSIGFCLPRPRDQLCELPSWVPDWRDVGANGLPQGLKHHRLRDLNASKNSRERKQISIEHVNPMAIRLPGYRVDIVTHVMAYDYQAENVLEEDRPSDWLARIRQFMGLLDNTGTWGLEQEDCVWRLALGCNNTLILIKWLHLENKEEDVSFFQTAFSHCQEYPDPSKLPETLHTFLHANYPYLGVWDPESLRKIRRKLVSMKSTLTTLSSNPNGDSLLGVTGTMGENAQMECAMERAEDLGDLQRDLKCLIVIMIIGLFRHSRARNTTLFRTAERGYGNGIGDVRPRDIVVILQNTRTPILLRPRQNDEGETVADSEGSGSTAFTFGGEAWVDGIMKGEFMDTNPREEVFEIY